MHPSSSPPGPNWDARNFVVALLGLLVAVAAFVVPFVLTRPDRGPDPVTPAAPLPTAAAPTAAGPTFPPPTDEPPTDELPTVAPRPTTPVRPRPRPPVPTADPDDAPDATQGTALVGSWRGGGNPSGDQYYESLEVTFTAGGAYSLTRAGLTPDTGRYQADDSVVEFHPDNGLQPYRMGWHVGRFGGAPSLELTQRTGYVSRLDKVD